MGVDRSFWSADILFEDDEEMGYQPGGVEGVVFPQPRVREMIEADPKK